MGKPVSRFLGEGVLIVFSILLALGVNEWRTRISDAQELNRIAADISKEIGDNLALLDGLPDYHRMIGRGLHQISLRLRDGGAGSGKTAVELFMELDNLRSVLLGLHSPLQSVSWRIAKDRDVIAQLDYETAKVLSTTYDEQLNRVMAMLFSLSDSLSEPVMHKASDQAYILAALAATFQELAAREDYLVRLLEESHSILRANYPEAVADEDQDRAARQGRELSSG